MTRRLGALALFVLFAALAAPSSPLTGKDKKPPPRKTHPLPTALKEALDKAEKVEFYSLEPDEAAGKNAFHGWKVLGKVELKNKDLRAKAVKAVTEGLTVGFAAAACFEPRHGVRLVRQGKSVDLVICFKCSNVRIYGLEKEKWPRRVGARKAGQAALDKVLSDAKVPLAKPAEK